MDESEIDDEIRSAWGWLGLEPAKVIAENDFGNLIIEDIKGAYWRLCPEECSCKRIAANRSELQTVLDDPEFSEDWAMVRIIEAAQQVCGPLSEGRKYALKIPWCLGGEYVAANYAIIPLREFIGFSGSVAFQAKDWPDGTKVELKVINRPDDQP